MTDATQAIKDFLFAVDRGYLGKMPSGFNDSAFVKALRDKVAEEHPYQIHMEMDSYDACAKQSAIAATNIERPER